MSKPIDQLELDLRNAHRAADGIRQLRRAKKDELDAATADRLEDLFGSGLRAAEATELAATKVLEEAKDAERLANVKLPYPVGTVLLEWKFYSSWSDELQLSGKRGVIEVITAESQHPGNISAYSRASIGTVVVRYLKADGKPSRNYSAWSAMSRPWSPEGVDLNKERNKQKK
jgi:hypothetical protein